MDEILFYLADVEGDADVRDMRQLVQALQASHGWADILEFVDVVEDAGMTRCSAVSSWPAR